MKELNRDTLRLLSHDISEAIKAIAEKHDISLTIGHTSYSSTTATMKLEVALKGAGGVIETKERRNWQLFASMSGLDATKLDQVIAWNGTQYKIVGLMAKGQRCPVLAERVADGKMFKLPASCCPRLPQVPTLPTNAR